MDDPAFLSIAIGVVCDRLGWRTWPGDGPVFGNDGRRQALRVSPACAGCQRPRSTIFPSGLLARPAAIDLGGRTSGRKMVPNAENLNLLYEQADVGLSFNRFMIVVAGLALAGTVFGVAFQLPTAAVPLAALVLGRIPVFLADSPPPQADPPVRRVDARSRRTDQPGVRRPRPGRGLAPGRRRDEGPDRR